MMTIKVYEVNRAGATVRVLRPTAEVVPVTWVDPSAAFPECECPRHRLRGDAAYRVFLGHTTQCAACRAGAPCATAARLGRAWRQARR